MNDMQSMRPLESVIGKGISIRGEVSGDENLFLNGQIEGSLDLGNKSLTVGPHGAIEADISAAELINFGRVEGNVTASNRVELKHSSSLTGDIKTARLSMEYEATIQGFVEIIEPLDDVGTEQEEMALASFEMTEPNEEYAETNG